MAKRAASPAAGPRPLKARGGVRQRLAQAASEPQSSKLAQLLLELWSWGDISTPMVQKLAAAAESDGIKSADLALLAGLGSRGVYPGNMHAELARRAPPSHIGEALSRIRVFYQNTRCPLGGIIAANAPIILPHELFSVMYHRYRSAFVKHILGGDAANIKSFWNSMRGDPYFDGHPCSKRHDVLTRAVPLALHGDGVSVVGIKKTWTKSVDAYSWSSLLVTGGSLICNNFLIFIMYWKLLVSTEAMNSHTHFCKVLAWSFYWLAVGRWPTRDVNDVPYPPESMEARRAAQQPYLADGYYGILYLCRADLEHMAKAYGFPQVSAADRCACCAANTSDRPWTDGRLDVALWVPTIWTDEAWHAEFPDFNPIFKIPGMGINSFLPDIMHCVYLGAYQYTLGSVIQYLTHEKLPGNADASCKTVWQDLQHQYRVSLKTCPTNLGL